MGLKDKTMEILEAGLAAVEPAKAVLKHLKREDDTS